MVHVPSGHKKEVDHQVECKLKACVSRLEEKSQQHRLRILNKLLKMLEPLSANCPVHDPVVTRHRDPHHAGHGGLTVRPRHHLLLGAAHGQDAGLGRVDDGGELVDAEHAQVGDGEAAALELLGL